MAREIRNPELDIGAHTRAGGDDLISPIYFQDRIIWAAVNLRDSVLSFARRRENQRGEFEA